MTSYIIASFFFAFLISDYSFAQSGRLESEYKLDVPEQDVAALWNFVKEKYGQKTFEQDSLHLSGVESIETFIDTYFDTPADFFVEEEISLRYRKRFKDKQLLKELIQLKIPFSEDKVIREEIKFSVDNKKKSTDISKRHSFLKYLNGSDTDRIRYHLAEYMIRPEILEESLKLKQRRSRIYISDADKESVATITLDEVTNFSFPFQSYAEVELELNEVRYTNASEAERVKMTALNNEIKKQLATQFPRLEVDQKSKYRKMKFLIDESTLSYIWDNIMWSFYGFIVLAAGFCFIKERLT